MSWSVTVIGTPEGCGKEIDAVEQTLSGQSRDEFAEAKPHLQGLLSQAVAQNVKLTANGHATFTDGKKTFGSISVSLECFYGKWCE